MSMFILRPYASTDARETLDLFYNTIHSVNLADYTAAQVDSWAPKDRPLASWNASLSRAYALVAVSDEGVIAGFADLSPDAKDGASYFDRLYVHQDYGRQGIATLLADAIEAEAKLRGFAAIETDASITSRPFFAKRRYIELRRNENERNGEVLVNYTMRKELR